MFVPLFYPCKHSVQTGFTLLEITIIVLIIGLLAAVISPNFSLSKDKKLDVAAYKVAEALRYARNEALHNKALRGVLVDTDDSDNRGKDITVFIPDTSLSPFGIQGILTHPVTKNDFDLQLSRIPSAQGVTFATSSKPFTFQGVSANKKYIFFSGNGTPVYLDNGKLYRFISGSIQLKYEDSSRSITIQPITGKVSIVNG